MAKRIGLFLVMNLLVVLTISVITAVLGLRPYLHRAGIDYGQLMAFCLVWGMGGAFVSLAMSRVMAKYAMGVQLVDEQTPNAEAQALRATVRRLADKLGLPMPEVGIYDSPDLNAFATGPTRSRALVAVSSGLLRRMDRTEIEGVLGHELSHVANGDMVTMTLLQGVVNAFVMFLARALAWAIVQGNRRDDREGQGSYMMMYVVQMVLEVGLMFLGMMLVAWFSRWREFRADAGSAQVAGREPMVRALRALARDTGTVEQVGGETAVAAFRISNPGGIGRLFATHPPLEQRIERLTAAA
jgi:heat shock protein HtpX